MERRELLRGLATGIAGTVAASTTVPGARAATPHSGHGAHGQPQSAPASPPPRLLDEHQRRTLASLAETILPGSTAAGVVDLIDRVAAVESPARQRRLLNAIGAFEREARTAHATRWIDLDEPTRNRILLSASTGPEGRTRPPVWTKGQPLVFDPTGPPPPATFRDHFEHVKSLVTGAYYSTEPGMRELGWVGRTAWKELPACTHPAPEHE